MITNRSIVHTTMMMHVRVGQTDLQNLVVFGITKEEKKRGIVAMFCIIIVQMNGGLTKKDFIAPTKDIMLLQQVICRMEQLLKEVREFVVVLMTGVIMERQIIMWHGDV